MHEPAVLARRCVALVFTAAIGLTGCDGESSLKEETLTFSPGRTASILGAKQVETFGVCAPTLEQRGARLYLWDEFIRQRDSGRPDGVQHLAGYEVAVTRGASCHVRILDTYQAAAWFDLSSLPSTAVVSAELRVDRYFSPLDPPSERGSSTQCSVMMAGEATEGWSSGIYHIDPDTGAGSGSRPFIASRPTQADAGPYDATGTSTLRVNVANTVSTWVRGVRPNNGFVIAPDPERTLDIYRATDEGRFMCDMGITDFELAVTVAVPDR